MEISFPAIKVSCGFSIDFNLSVKNTQNGPSQSLFLMVTTRKTNIKYNGDRGRKGGNERKKINTRF